MGPTSGPMDFILQGPLYGPLCKVGLKLRPTSSPSGLNSKRAPSVKWPWVVSHGTKPLPNHTLQNLDHSVHLSKFGWFCSPLHSYYLTVWGVANLKFAKQRSTFKVGDDERHSARARRFLGSCCCVGKSGVDSRQGAGGAAAAGMALPSNYTDSGRPSAPYPRAGWYLSFASHRSLM